MDWINIDDEFPEDKTDCLVFLPGVGIFHTSFVNDSFSLGLADYLITHWQPFSKSQYPDIHDLRQNPESTSLAAGHKVVCFSGLSSNLAS